MTDLITAEDVERILNLLRSETEAASRTDAADMIEALHAELAQARADAKAAVAVAVEKARNTLASLQEWSPYEAGSPESAAWIKGATGVAERADAAIASIVPEDAIAEVARIRQNAEATNGVWQANLRLIAERDRLAAELAAAIAREAGLRAALGDMVDLFSADNVLRKGTHLNATLKLARIAIAQPSTEGGA